MSLKFDHYVHLTNSPEETSDEFEKIGLHVVPGGRHEHAGTYNHLSYFGLSYIEIIGVFDYHLVKEATSVKYSLRDTFAKNNFEEGPQRIALRHDNLQQLADQFKEAGLEVNGPVDFSRKRPDGSLVTWKLLFAGKPSESIRLPFFIQWDESDEERLADLKKRGVIGTHEAGSVSIDGAAFTVNNLEAAVSNWSELLQLEKGEIVEDTEWNAKAQRLKLPGGDIIFYEPLGEGIVKNALDSKGEGLFALQFKSSDKASTTISKSLYRFI